MPLTMKQVIDAILPDEPDYRAAAASLGTEALPLLRQLVQSDNLELATKAASLAGHIKNPGAMAVLSIAAQSPLPSVRVAAAAATRHLPTDQASRVLTALIADADPAVRKIAISAVPRDAGDELRAAVSRAGPQAYQTQPMTAVAESADDDSEAPDYPMIDPMEMSGESAGAARAAGKGAAGAEREPFGSYPTVGAEENEQGLDAPPGAAGY